MEMQLIISKMHTIDQCSNDSVWVEHFYQSQEFPNIMEVEKKTDLRVY